MAVSPALLQKYGFVPVTQEPIPFFFVSIEAATKNGKTHTALTAPDPIAYLDFDRGFEDIKPKFPGRQIHQVKLDLPQLFETPAETQEKMKGADLAARMAIQKLQTEKRACLLADHAAEKWGIFLNVWKDILDPKSGFKTVVVDTASALWETCALAKFGKMVQVPQMLWAPVKAEFRSLMLMPYNKRAVNVILLHHLKDEYAASAQSGSDKSERTGKKIKRGFADIGEIVQAQLKINRVDATPKQLKDGEPASRFRLQFLDSRTRPELNGYVMESGRDEAEIWEAMDCPEDMIPPPTIPVVGKLMWPRTELSSWQ